MPVLLLGSGGASGLRKPPTERFYAEAEFYDDLLQRNYFADMETYLKQTLGLQSPW